MKAKRTKEFRSQKEETKGQMRYQYLMTGTPEEQVEFKKQQGKYLLPTKDGTVLWNRTDDYGKNPDVVVNQAGKFTMIMDEDQVAYEKAEKRPLFAQMYFDQAQVFKSESMDEKNARRTGKKSVKKVAVKATDDGTGLED